ncbi:MAG: DUF2461 domain-containing protein [Bacteroidales bacterium]|jgi:uncharacterized protein (TIGR02453 family)|nr:DUF2461 domain-containing protein [Bacteroidales bacterium]
MLQHTFSFLRELVANNHKEWFDAHRDQYLKAKQEYFHFIDLLIDEIRNFDPSIGSVTASDCVFRIYRDVRFSADKTPYKNHFGAYIAQGGRKSILSGYYFHIEPAGSGYLNHSLWAGGVYNPDAHVLKAVRTDIYENTDEYKDIIYHKAFTGCFKWFDGSPVKTVPKGFPNNFVDVALIKPRDFSFYRNIDEALLKSDQLMEKSIEVFKKMLPFNRFMNRAIRYHQELES